MVTSYDLELVWVRLSTKLLLWYAPGTQKTEIVQIVELRPDTNQPAFAAEL